MVASVGLRLTGDNGPAIRALVAPGEVPGLRPGYALRTMAAAPRPPAFRGRSSERAGAGPAARRRARGPQRRARASAARRASARRRCCATPPARPPGSGSLQIAGVESEMELPFAGLHQLCAPLLGRLDALPAAAAGRAAGRVRPRRRRRAGPLPRRPGHAHAAGGGRRDAAAAVPRRRPPVARRRLRAGARVRRPAAARRAGRDRVRRARAERASASWRACRSCGWTGSATRTRARCWRRSSPAGSTSASASGSSPRRAATRSRCWSCRAA